MTEQDNQWERELVTKLATAALKEQRRARLWGIFFKLLAFGYVTLILLMAVEWKRGDTSHDLEMARAAGVDALGVTYGAHREEGLRACGPLGCFSSVAQLSEWLQTNA